jgi:hypothetical protein
MLATVYRNGFVSENIYNSSILVNAFDLANTVRKAKPNFTPEQIEKFREFGAKRGKLTYKLTPRSKRIFMSRAIRMFQERKFKVSTIILTYNRNEVENPYKDLNRFLTYAHKYFKLRRYMAALELTKNNQWHFHLLVEMPFVPVSKINEAWCNARGYYSGNAVRDVRNVKNSRRAAWYAFAYLKKGESKEHEKRKFTSSRLLKGLECIHIPVEWLEERFKTVWKKTVDFCLLYQFDISKGFDRFFCACLADQMNSVLIPVEWITDT